MAEHQGGESHRQLVHLQCTRRYRPGWHGVVPALTRTISRVLEVCARHAGRPADCGAGYGLVHLDCLPALLSPARQQGQVRQAGQVQHRSANRGGARRRHRAPEPSLVRRRAPRHAVREPPYASLESGRRFAHDPAGMARRWAWLQVPHGVPGAYQQRGAAAVAGDVPHHARDLDQEIRSSARHARALPDQRPGQPPCRTLPRQQGRVPNFSSTEQWACT